MYARVSSEQQAEAQTIASQVAALRERVASEGLTVPSAMQFLDEGTAGRPSSGRPSSGCAMWWRHGPWIASLCTPDRLARNMRIRYRWSMMPRAGVEVIFSTGP
jgi:site-specific DNA recombinase